MFDWLGDILAGLGDAIAVVFENSIGQIVDSIWTEFVRWIYNAIYGAMADGFTNINQMGAEVFDLPWAMGIVNLFTLLGWTLYVIGVVMAVFDIGIEAQTGRASIKTTALNVLKGFFACSLLGTLPVELYKFSISLQNSFSHDLIRIFTGTVHASFGSFLLDTVNAGLNTENIVSETLLGLLILVAFCYSVVKIFFANIKRGGILLIQIAVGSLYLFSVPRGYADGFWQWCKQVIATCLTAFLQTTLLFLGMITFQTSLLLGLGIMLAAGEVPRIAQQFGLDSSVKLNVSSILHTTNTAVNLSKALRAGK